MSGRGLENFENGTPQSNTLSLILLNSFNNSFNNHFKQQFLSPITQRYPTVLTTISSCWPPFSGFRRDWCSLSKVLVTSTWRFWRISMFNQKTAGGTGTCNDRQFLNFSHILQNFTSGWWFGTWILFSILYGIILPIDFHIFQDG